MMSNEAMAFLTWIGFFISLIGFGITIYQLYRLKNNAVLVRETIDRMTNHIDSVDLAYLNSQVGIIFHLVQNNGCHQAEIVFITLKRHIRLHANSKKLDDSSKEALNRTIGKIDKQISWGKSAHEKFDRDTAGRLIDDLLSQLTNWESSVMDKIGRI